MSALSVLERSRGKAIGHVMTAAITLDANIKLIRRHSVLSASSLPAALTKEAYHLPLEPASSSLFGEGLLPILEKSDRMTEEKRQRALHKAALQSVKINKSVGQQKAKQATHGSEPKKGAQKQHTKKKKQFVKKGGQPSSYKHDSSTKGGGKTDAQQLSSSRATLPACDPCEHSCHVSVGGRLESFADN